MLARLVAEGEATGGDRESADRRRPPRLGSGLRRRGRRRVPAGAAPRLQRRRPRGAGHRRRHGELPGDVRARSGRPVPRRRGRQDRAVGAGAGAAAVAGHAGRPARRRCSTRRPPTACTRSPRCSSSPSPTARRGSATAATCRSTSCLLRRTSTRDVPWSVRRASRELRPGAPGGREPRLSSARAHGVGGVRTSRPGLGEPTVLDQRRDARRHLPRRRRRPVGQHHLGDAERRLAAELADGAGSRVLPRQPDADVLAGGRARRRPSRRAGDRARRCRRRWCCATEPRCMACGSPGGDQQDQWQLLFLLRRLVGGQELQEAIDAPTLAHDLAARARSTRATWSRAGWSSRTGSARRSSTSSRAAGTTSRARDRGRWAGCAQSCVTRPPVICRLRRTRGASRATPPAAEGPASRQGRAARGRAAQGYAAAAIMSAWLIARF